MQRVVGLDISLTSTGLAIITRRVEGSTLVNTHTITSRGKRDDGLAERAERIADLASHIATLLGNPKLVVIESPAFGARGGSTLDRSGLWWRVVGELAARNVPTAVCPPTVRAKFATGKGNADKAAVSAAVARLWPDLEVANSDEADAVALAHAGAVRLGWDVETLARHHDCLAGIRWPGNLETTGEEAA